MMKHLKHGLAEKMLTNERTYGFTKTSLEEYRDLPKGSMTLLRLMLDSVGIGHTLESILLSVDYRDYGYSHRQNFFRDRKPLITTGFLLSKNNQTVVNPSKVNYFTKSQRKAFLILTGLKHDYVPDWTGKIPKPPKPSSN